MPSRPSTCARSTTCSSRCAPSGSPRRYVGSSTRSAPAAQTVDGETDETIPVELGGVTRFIQRSDVRYAEAQGDYARLHTADDSHLVRVPLTTLEQQWADAGFVRIHRSHLVALHHIDEMQRRLRPMDGPARRRGARGEPPAHPRAARHAGAARAAGAAPVTEPHTATPGPRRLAAHPRRPAPPLPDRCVARSTSRRSLGDVYMRSLVRLQLRLAIGVCLIMAVLLGGLPLLLVLEPELSDVEVRGIPLPWLLLGVVVYPVLVGAAWLYVRQAERNERDFAELVQ